MKIAQIPSNEPVVMTAEMHRLFNAGGCDPACHGCWKKLPTGTKFKLSTVKIAHSSPGNNKRDKIKSKEVMLCETCTPENVSERAMKLAQTEGELLGCFRINGKIVH
jgi:hypothetical protein